MSEDQLPRDFKGLWIPKEIWLDKRLSYFEKCLFAEISSLDGEEGCYASNEYFMKFFEERERKIQEGISKLKKLELIYEAKFDGRTRFLKINHQNIYANFRTSEVRKSAPLPCGNPHPSNKKDTYNKNKDKNKDNNRRPAVSSPAGTVVVHSVLKDKDIPQAEKEWISKRYTEDQVKVALAYTESPETEIETSYIQTLKWACKTQPEPNVKVDEASNKKRALDLVKAHEKDDENWSVSVLSDSIEIIPILKVNRDGRGRIVSKEKGSAKYFSYKDKTFWKEFMRFIEKKIPDMYNCINANT